VPDAEPNRGVKTAFGRFLCFIALLFSASALALSPVVVWPAAVGNLLPFAYTTTAWLEVASLPGCFLLAATAALAFELGDSYIE
jgi:hypothetical protein